MGAVDAGKKNVLIGPAPFTSGKVSALTPGGVTTIGGGLKLANEQFPAPGPGVNQKTVLLMTDGLENTPPMIADVNSALGGVDLSAIGFGTESSLDGALLDRLAQNHGGVYTRAGTGLQLKKFFVLAFGNIFEAGTLADPEYDLPAAENQKSVSFSVCGDDSITVVLGWDRTDATLIVQLVTPAGTTITAGTPGVDASVGLTWMFLRLPLPIAGERDGTWRWVVFRPGGGEFPPPAVDMRFFVNAAVKGGPVLVRLGAERKYYTGDDINPLVVLRNGDGSTPRNARVKLTVTGPAESIGNLLSQAKLGPATVLGGDVIPARQATLMAIEHATSKPAVTYSSQIVDLFDDGVHDDGAMEPDGIFGNPLADLLRTEGSYAFHAVATYGDTCVATRELLWSVHIDVGVDPGTSIVTIDLGSPGAGGASSGTVTITPKDKYGNNLEPGRSDGIVITGVPGTTVTGPAADGGDGTYTVPVTWNPGAGGDPGVVVGQPGRPPAVVGPKPKHRHCRKCKLCCWLLVLLVVLSLIIIFAL